MDYFVARTIERGKKERKKIIVKEKKKKTENYCEPESTYTCVTYRCTYTDIPCAHYKLINYN